VDRDEALNRLRALGFDDAGAEALWEHFDDAERRGKLGHGHSRIPWLETLEGFDPRGAVSPVLRHDGYWRWNARNAVGYLALADAGLVGVLTATSPARLGPPEGPKVAGTNPLSIAVPGGVVVDVSMGAVTWGDVIAGRATEEELVPFGDAHRHKALALALGLQLLVDALVTEPGYGAVLLVARPEADPVPALRELGIRLPGSGADG
jgi:LDH2 family malate/lactate/ureidoglycolate dehydrogenase